MKSLIFLEMIKPFLLIELLWKSVYQYELFDGKVIKNKDPLDLKKENHIYSILFPGESWEVELFRYNITEVQILPNLVIDGKHVYLDVNYFAVINRNLSETVLGYFQINEEINGYVEVKNHQYYVVTLTRLTIIIKSRKLERVVLNKLQTILKLRQGTYGTHICSIRVIIGPTLYDVISDTVTFWTVNDKVMFLHNLVNKIYTEINSIYGSLPTSIRINFLVKQLFILTPNLCANGFKGMIWPFPIDVFCNESAAHEELLDAFSNIFDPFFCLTSVFINREFVTRVLGYATRNSMCDYTRSFRTFFVNLAARNVLYEVLSISLTVAHEIGHTLGALHDQNTICKYALIEYIMTGEFNNPIPEFSQCSIDSMEQYMTKYNDTCFANRIPSSFCGNGILEEPEQCDCGNQTICPCCNPQVCLLILNAECSVFGKDGMCCNSSNCKWKSRALNIRCSIRNECSPVKFCFEKYGCLHESPIQAKVICANNSRLCRNETCKESICSLWKLKEYPSKKVCNQTCQLYCFSTRMNLSFDLSELVIPKELANVNISLINYQVGHRCMERNKFCGPSGKCETLLGILPNSVTIFALINPIFCQLLAIQIKRSMVIIILCFLCFLFFSLCIFEIPFACENVIIYRFLFKLLPIEKRIINKINLNCYKSFIKTNKVQPTFTISETSMLVNEIMRIREIRFLNKYLLRKQSLFELDGKFLGLENNEIMNKLMNV